MYIYIQLWGGGGMKKSGYNWNIYRARTWNEYRVTIIARGRFLLIFLDVRYFMFSQIFSYYVLLCIYARMLSCML